MSLTLVQQTAPLTYEPCQPGDGVIYNPYLCTPPRMFREELNHGGTGISGFYYDPNKDRYILISSLSVAYWPSWEISAYTIHPVTGRVESRTNIPSIFGIAYDRYQETGEFKRPYANHFAGPNSNSIVTIDPVTFVANWNDLIVTSADVGGFQIQRFLLNRSNHIVALQDVGRIRRYNYGTQVRLDDLLMPEAAITDLAYEDLNRGWVLLNNPTHGLSTVKIDYVNAKIELLSKIQSEPDDINSSIAYDSRRKMIAVFRQREEAVDGSATHLLDIYKPVIVPTNITAPVPVEPLVQGKTITMVAHLIGDRGEAGSLRPVTITNTGDGVILQPTVTPRSNGTVTFQYRVGNNPGTDTITLEVEI